MIRIWKCCKKHVFSPIKLAAITVGIVNISNHSGNENPYLLFVPLGILMFFGFISLTEDAVISANSGKPLDLF